MGDNSVIVIILVSPLLMGGSRGSSIVSGSSSSFLSCGVVNGRLEVEFTVTFSVGSLIWLCCMLLSRRLFYFSMMYC